MKKLIDADALIEDLRKDKEDIYSHVFCHVGCDAEDSLLYDLEQMINNQPTIEAVPVVHGYNDNQNYHEADEFRCSVCGLHLEDWSRRICDEDTGDEFFVEYVFKYCPECGAKMDGGK